MESKIQKPPTQGVGVQGFKADLYASDEVKIDWERLIHLPKFQMFTFEMTAGRYGEYGIIMHWILAYIQDQIRIDGEQGFFDKYVKWHDAKGYWKSETVYGELS